MDFLATEGVDLYRDIPASSLDRQFALRGSKNKLRNKLSITRGRLSMRAGDR